MTADALIHLRVPAATKARWVRASRAAGIPGAGLRGAGRWAGAVGGGAATPKIAPATRQTVLSAMLISCLGCAGGVDGGCGVV